MKTSVFWNLMRTNPAISSEKAASLFLIGISALCPYYPASHPSTGAGGRIDDRIIILCLFAMQTACA